MSDAGLQCPTRYYMVVMKQRIGLSKALEEPQARAGQEHAMASMFWTTSRHARVAQVRALRPTASATVGAARRLSR